MKQDDDRLVLTEAMTEFIIDALFDDMLKMAKVEIDILLIFFS